TRVPKTNVRCLFKDGINVRKCSNLVDYRTASIFRWKRNNGYLSPPSMLMAAAKFQWEDPAAGWLGGCQSKNGRDQADLSGSRNTGKIVVKYAMGLCKISTPYHFFRRGTVDVKRCAKNAGSGREQLLHSNPRPAGGHMALY